MSLRRIAEEQASLQRDPLDACSAGPENSRDLQRWIGHIVGPSGTTYEQETFFYTIMFPDNYPMKPFQLTFSTSISHPAISEEGEVRLPELEAEHWSPVQTVRSILLCLRVALSNPDQFDGNSASEDGKAKLSKLPQGHGVSSNAVRQTTKPTHHGRRIEGKKYGMDMSRPEYEVYTNLTDGREKDKFFMDNADAVRDL